MENEKKKVFICKECNYEFVSVHDLEYIYDNKLTYDNYVNINCELIHGIKTNNNFELYPFICWNCSQVAIGNIGDKPNTSTCESCKNTFNDKYMTRDYDIFHHFKVCYNCKKAYSHDEKVQIKYNDNLQQSLGKTIYELNTFDCNIMQSNCFSNLILDYLCPKKYENTFVFMK
jgi:hypothetical protein